MNKPKITVVTVSYNAVDTIEKTILSVINQTYKNIEHIIIDGASTDGTIDVINRYHSRITSFVSEPDKGIYDAMNKGCNLAKGDYVFFLNSDDVFYNNNVLESVVSKMEEGLDVVYYGDVIMLPIGKRYGGSFNKWRLSVRNICHQSIFYPRSVFEKYTYLTKYKLYADWVLNIMCKGDPFYRFQHINTIIAYFNIEGVSSSRKDASFHSDKHAIIKQHLGLLCYWYSRLRNSVHDVLLEK